MGIEPAGDGLLHPPGPTSRPDAGPAPGETRDLADLALARGPSSRTRWPASSCPRRRCATACRLSGGSSWSATPWRALGQQRPGDREESDAALELPRVRHRRGRRRPRQGLRAGRRPVHPPVPRCEPGASEGRGGPIGGLVPGHEASDAAGTAVRGVDGVRQLASRHGRHAEPNPVLRRQGRPIALARGAARMGGPRHPRQPDHALQHASTPSAGPLPTRRGGGLPQRQDSGAAPKPADAANARLMPHTSGCSPRLSCTQALV